MSVLHRLEKYSDVWVVCRAIIYMRIDYLCEVCTAIDYKCARTLLIINGTSYYYYYYYTCIYDRNMV